MYVCEKLCVNILSVYYLKYSLTFVTLWRIKVEMDNLVEPTSLVVYDTSVMNDCISATTDTFEECNDISTNLSKIAESTATSGPYENDSTSSSGRLTFPSIVYNDLLTQPSDRNRVLLAPC